MSQFHIVTTEDDKTEELTVAARPADSPIGRRQRLVNDATALLGAAV